MHLIRLSRLASFVLMVAITLGTSFAVNASVTLPAIFSDHAVLRASAATRIWGHAAAGETVNVSLAGQMAQTSADHDGRWQVALDLRQTGPGPFDLIVKGSTTLKISDVLVGELWLASGQSNMEFGLAGASGAAVELVRPANPQLRFFKVALVSTAVPQDDVQGHWVFVSPETAAGISAVAYYFARDVQAALKVPVGIINSSWGGSSAEAWISPATLASLPAYKPSAERDWALTENAPARQAAFVHDFSAWLATHRRADHPSADVTTFTRADIDPAGWAPVTLANPIAASGLNPNGAVWLRRTVTIPAILEGKPVLLRSGPLTGLPQIYWNGRLIHENTLATYGGRPDGIWFRVPPALVHSGENRIALRVYAPAGPVAFEGDKFSVEGEISDTGWLAKSEFTLDDPSTLPPPPAAPPKTPVNREVPGYLFNGMLHPLLPATLSGVIWYQGETNTARAAQYRVTFPLLITDWRTQFGQGDLPFYFCQLPVFKAKHAEPEESDWAEVRESQSFALKLPATGAAVLIDTGEANDIHPLDKAPAGTRLARFALARTYGKTDIVASGPVYSGHEIAGSQVVVRFTDIAGGLVAQSLPATYDLSRSRGTTAPLVHNSPGSPLEGFQLCGADRKWIWAEAKIDGATVVVSSPKVPAPVAVRYGWASNPTANLFNTAGLPAAPFRTDDFPLSTQSLKF